MTEGNLPLMLKGGDALTGLSYFSLSGVYVVERVSVAAYDELVPIEQAEYQAY